MRQGRREVRHSRHRGRRPALLGRHRQGPGGRRYLRDVRIDVRRYRGGPGRDHHLQRPQVQVLPRHGFAGCDGGRLQGPLLPGQDHRDQETRTRGHRRPRPLQGHAGRDRVPADRRPEVRHGLLRRAQHPRTAAGPLHQGHGQRHGRKPPARRHHHQGNPQLHQRRIKIMATGNVRPADMERITTPALAQKFIEEQVKELREQIGDRKVLLALSGGVDSSVVAALLIKAVGKQLVSVHVNHGLLRKGEPEQVVKVFRDELNANLIYVDATDRFLDKLAGVADPEQKRKIIGAEFIRVFEEEARKLEGISFLAQGTIYPDIVESGPVKSHHNVGGLPEDLQFELVEPIKLLFKDEVRVVGKELGLPDNMVYRQPFPGPGLGVRCTGAITRDRLEALRESDAILREEFARNGLGGKVWQYFTIVPDYKSTGVKDNKRSWDWPVIIRAVNTRDAMTATIEEIPYELLHHITRRIITEVPGVNRVLYDLTPKPTGTIEWE
ncbi:MAG: glutamine-hydrolyzing GMP synthase [Bacteroidales bacterium]|nr:glutamine-hydrolyzing GMP synthase [Bacteroidales bacterium]